MLTVWTSTQKGFLTTRNNSCYMTKTIWDITVIVLCYHFVLHNWKHYKQEKTCYIWVCDGFCHHNKLLDTHNITHTIPRHLCDISWTNPVSPRHPLDKPSSIYKPIQQTIKSSWHMNTHIRHPCNRPIQSTSFLDSPNLNCLSSEQ